jgi:PPOX class probable F420-dependent enzyme
VEVSRPHMPGYGIEPATEGRGLLPWSWAEERLVASRDYWVTTVRPDGSPHVMPVWGAWFDDALWFSSGGQSRKARNLDENPHCAIATENGTEPVVVEGRVEIVTDAPRIRRFAGIINAKYDEEIPDDFYDPAVNRLYRVAPERVIGMIEQDFTTSPTRWTFE